MYFPNRSRDQINPTAVCVDVTIEVDGNGDAIFDASVLDGGSTDNCPALLDFTVDGSATVTITKAEILALGGISADTTLTLTATDPGGNMSTCTSVVSFVDNTDPSVTCVGDFDLALGDSPDSAYVTIDDIISSASDNWGLADTSITGQTGFSCEDWGQTFTVTITVTDSSSNTAECTTDITIVDTNCNCDTITPVITNCPSAITLELPNTVSPSVTIEQGDYTDGTAPTCEGTPFEDPFILYLGANGEATLVADSLDGGSYDNCNNDSLIFSINEYDETGWGCEDLDPEVHAIELTVTDLGDNSSTCLAYVSVEDTVSPIADCAQNVEVFLDANGEATLTAFDGVVIGNKTNINDMSWDACGIDSSWISKQIFNCSSVGKPDTVMLWAADPNGNVSSCSAIVMVHDTLAPTISVDVTDTIMKVAEPGDCEVEITYPDAMAMDNCEATLMQTEGLGPDGMFPLGATTETWVAVDAYGNTSAEASFVVMVTKTNAPPAIDSIADVEVAEDTEMVDVWLPEFLTESTAWKKM